MKKIIALFLVVISLFLIVSCNNSQSDNSQSNNQGNIDEGNNNSGISSIDKETLEIERNHYMSQLHLSLLWVTFTLPRVRNPF